MAKRIDNFQLATQKFQKNIDIFDFELTESEMLNIGALDRGERYYKRSSERFERYLNMKIPFED